MMKESLSEKIKIEPLDEAMLDAARKRQAKLAKPPGSLGTLEDISVHLAGITGKLRYPLDKQCILIMCSDNGVIEEGVASAPRSVTMSQTINFTKKLTGVGALAKTLGCDLMITDVGIAGKVPADFVGEGIGVVRDRKIAFGTKNIFATSAMTYEQALQSINVGIETALEAAGLGYHILGVGEMGIANTTTGAAVLSALTAIEPEEIVGRGGGVTDMSFAHKKDVVRTVAARAAKFVQDPIRVLAEAGGFDIGAMAGAYLGAASKRIPVVIDGFISAVAALLAMKLNPLCRDYMFASHKSVEAGYKRAITELGLSPLFDLNMRLGEGSGCAIAFKIIEGAEGILSGMGTFEEAQIDDEYLEEIRRGDCF